MMARRLILHIEDAPSNVELMRQIIRRHGGFDLASAGSGVDGLQACLARPPDLIITDRHLPDMTCDALLDMLHADDRFVSIPVIVVTGDPDTDHGETMKNGVKAVLLKPFTIRELLELIEAALPGDEAPAHAG